MNKLDNLSHYEEKTLSSDKCPICNSNLWIISNWMNITFDGPQWEYCESNEEHIFSEQYEEGQVLEKELQLIWNSLTFNS